MMAQTPVRKSARLALAESQALNCVLYAQYYSVTLRGRDLLRRKVFALAFDLGLRKTVEETAHGLGSSVTDSRDVRAAASTAITRDGERRSGQSGLLIRLQSLFTPDGRSRPSLAICLDDQARVRGSREAPRYWDNVPWLTSPRPPRRRASAQKQSVI